MHAHVEWALEIGYDVGLVSLLTTAGVVLVSNMPTLHVHLHGTMS